MTSARNKIRMNRSKSKQELAGTSRFSSRLVLVLGGFALVAAAISLSQQVRGLKNLSTLFQYPDNSVSVVVSKRERERERERENVETYKNPSPKESTPICTAEQRAKIASTLGIPTNEEFDSSKPMGRWRQGRWFACPDSKWLDEFYEEDADINSSDCFLGISVGCNKGHDAIRTARMGMSSAEFDAVQWSEAFHAQAKSVCGQDAAAQAKIVYPKRKGEMHCIEPMPSTFSELKQASDSLGLEQKGFFVANYAISSADGVVRFTNGAVGTENQGIGSCRRNCQEVPASSLEGYVEKHVKGNGPVNVLQIDTEGWDFDVLFGASSVLDRTHYLEFEYHNVGNWGKLHLHDAVRLLDRKGFTCYWATQFGTLIKITECYFTYFDYWHGWSNVVCAHRSQNRLWKKMEQNFEKTLESF